MSNSYDHVLFPPGYAYGFTGGPAFDTRITKMDGAGEMRVQVQEEPIWRWSAVRKNFADGADVNGLCDFFLARHGALYGWLFLDARDHSTNPDGYSPPTMLDQLVGIGDGVTRRFRFRKQYSDPGGMTARLFPRRIVPMTGTATAPMARLFGIDSGADITPLVSVDGVQVFDAEVLPMSQEILLQTAPAIGENVRIGCYFASVVRFSETTDKGLDMTIAGFRADEAAFEVESIPFDDPVPLVCGGSPYGHRDYPFQLSNFELSGRDVFLHVVEASAAISGYLDDLANYPTGGPHVWLINTGTFSIVVRDALGSAVGTVTAGGQARLMVKEDDSGNRTPLLI